MIEAIRPTEKQMQLITKFNGAVKHAMELLMEVPTCREASLSFTKLEEAEMWLAKAVLYNMDQEKKQEDRPVIALQ